MCFIFHVCSFFFTNRFCCLMNFHPEMQVCWNGRKEEVKRPTCLVVLRLWIVRLLLNYTRDQSQRTCFQWCIKPCFPLVMFYLLHEINHRSRTRLDGFIFSGDRVVLPWFIKCFSSFLYFLLMICPWS
jgi:hypothetical protein